MSSSHRDKDSGQYKPHTGGVPKEPAVDHLDLGATTKPATAGFHKGPLTSGDGRARDPGELAGPTVAPVAGPTPAA